MIENCLAQERTVNGNTPFQLEFTSPSPTGVHTVRPYYIDLQAAEGLSGAILPDTGFELDIDELLNAGAGR
jgi:hypothetical protein